MATQHSRQFDPGMAWAKLYVRFASKVHRLKGRDACWLWTGAKSGNGYGQFYFNGRMMPAHRYAYEREYGPIPDGLEMDHLCRNRACVRPRHLRAVDHRTNVLAGNAPSAIRARATHCAKGHPLVKRGKQRRCLVCRRERDVMKARAVRAAQWAAFRAAADARKDASRVGSNR